MATPSQRFLEADEELRKLTREAETLRSAINDKQLVAWVHERGPVPRKLTTFEAATVKRLVELDDKISDLAESRGELLADAIVGLSGMVDVEPDDPEALLRASLVALNRLYKKGHSSPESMVVMKALASYLKSLSQDP